MPNFWALLINRWQLMGSILLTAIILVGAWIALSVPLYTASTTLLIEPPQSLSERIDAEDAQDRYYQRHVDLLKSAALAAEVIKSLHLEENASFSQAQNTSLGQRLGTWVSHAFSRVLTYGSYLIVGAAPASSPPSRPATSETNISSALVHRYLTLLTVTPDPYTYAAEVAFTTPDPVLSQELANTHAATFARTSQIVRFEPSPEQAAFLAQELATQEARLVQAEAALQQFRQAHPDITPASKDNLAAQRLLQTQQRFTTAQAKRIEAALLSHITREKEATQLITLIKSDRLTHLRAAFNRLEVEHTRLTGLLASSHPRLSELANTKEAARQQLEQELAALVATLETEYTAARNAEAVLQEEAAQQRKTALDRGEFAVVTAALNADIASVQTLVHTVRKRQQDRALLKALPDPNITVTTLAEVPLTPTSPQPMRDFLLAFLGGTIAAVSLAFFLEWTDTSVRTAQDVWQATTYPLLGVIPPRAAQLEAIVQLSQQAHRRSLQGQDELAADVSSDIFTEQTAIQDLVDESYHLLSTRLPIGQKQSPRTFLFTSPYADDDKTSTLLSLAVTLAGQGYKVVVVDADLRTGHCHTLLQKDQSIGLSEVLRDGAAFVSSRRHTRKRRTENHPEVNSSAFELPQDEHANGTQRTRSSPKLKALVESAIQTTTIDGLSLIACGQAPLTPEGQLGSDTLPEVLDVLRRKFTCVLIDSPAAMTSGDAELLAQLSNATILVLRGYKTPMAAAYRVAGQLQVVRAKVLGVVLTNVNPHAIDLLEHR